MGGTEEEKEWPVYFKDCLSVGNPESSVGICTLWTKQERVRAHIDGSLYSVLGNLYSPDGINYLLRNLMANPRIRHIVLCGMDVTGSGEALVILFNQGIDENRQIKGTEAVIDDNLPDYAIKLVRERVQLTDLRGPIREDKLIESINIYFACLRVRERIGPGGLRGLQIRRGTLEVSLVGSTPIRSRQKYVPDITLRIKGTKGLPGL